MSFLEANLSKTQSSDSPTLAAAPGAGIANQQPEQLPEQARRRGRGLMFPLEAMRAAVDQKGLDVRGLDISSSSVADYFVIVSGTSERHVKGIADKVKQELEKLQETPLSVSGYEQGEWVLIDYGDLVVHIFFEPMRQYYGLDELWGKRGTPIEPGPELEKNLRMLRTGIAW